MCACIATCVWLCVASCIARFVSFPSVVVCASALQFHVCLCNASCVALHSYSVVVCVALVSLHWLLLYPELAKYLEGLTYTKAKNASYRLE